MLVQTSPSLTFCNSIKKCFSKYCTFSGRARRSEFWFFACFFAIIIGIPFIIIFSEEINMINESFENQKIISKCKEDKKYDDSQDYSDCYNMEVHSSYSPIFYMSIIFIIFGEIILFIPMVSVSVRRLHDIGKSGTFLILYLIPLGNIILLILFVQDSQQTDNQYGPSPKYTLVQNNAPLVNNSQIIPLSGIQYPNMPFIQGYPQVYQYPINPQCPVNPQYPQPIQGPQIPVQQNIYTELQEV